MPGRPAAAQSTEGFDLAIISPALHEQAMSLHMRGALADAERLYRQILEREPDNTRILTMLGVLAAQSGRIRLAADLLQHATKLNGSDPLAHNNFGIVLTALGRFEEAIAHFDRAISTTPDYADAYTNRGVAYGRMQRFDDALRSYDAAIRLQPNSAVAHDNRGSALRRLGRRPEALQSYDRAIALMPEFAQAHVNRATLLLELDRPEDALVEAERAVALQPSAEALVARGDACQQLRRLSEALSNYDQAIAQQPPSAAAYSHRGSVLCLLRRPEDALASCDRAIAMEPGSSDAYVNRGNALKDLQRIGEALASFDQALALDANDATAYYNRATVLVLLRRFDEALAGYDRALALKANEAEVHFNQALCLLLTGQFEPGWQLYEWRKRRRPPIADRVLPCPLWTGEQDLRGKTLLMHWEQGLGDTIQFCRYANLAAERGARSVLDIQPPLRRLLRTLNPAVEIVAGDAPPAADFHIPMMSLPAAFETRGETIPAGTAYLHAEPDRVARWRRHIGEEGFKVGVSWQGSTLKVDVGRSFPLAALHPLASIPGVRLISLQKNQGVSQLQTLPAGMCVETLGDDFDPEPHAFLDSAAVMANLDLIVTSDTAIAHLAGALARPAWVALKQVPDWRWMLDRTDSPWYPSLRLFRQKAAGDWSEVFAEMHRELRSHQDSRRRREVG
jgi:tetratricopeptide (TPR) repeat protein